MNKGQGHIFLCTEKMGLYTVVGWRDVTLFSIFENLHSSVDHVYIFRSLITKNQQFRPCALHPQQSFHFQKSQGP